MRVFLIVLVASFVGAVTTTLITLMCSRKPTGTLLSHHPYRRHLQDVDKESCECKSTIFRGGEASRLDRASREMV